MKFNHNHVNLSPSDGASAMISWKPSSSCADNETMKIDFFSSSKGENSFNFPISISDHVREFACGKHYYRTFLLHENSNALFVGSMWVKVWIIKQISLCLKFLIIDRVLMISFDLRRSQVYPKILWITSKNYLSGIASQSSTLMTSASQPAR